MALLYFRFFADWNAICSRIFGMFDVKWQVYYVNSDNKGAKETYIKNKSKWFRYHLMLPLSFAK